jgi:site-specific DNA-cytosine methylase
MNPVEIFLAGFPCLDFTMIYTTEVLDRSTGDLKEVKAFLIWP